MKVSIVLLAVICTVLVESEFCDNEDWCEKSCCKSWFHYRCCPYADGVCCPGGFQCCPSGNRCIMLGTHNFCSQRALTGANGKQEIAMESSAFTKTKAELREGNPDKLL
ncbi:progranulin-like [Stegodyphus dumicola]|uniref:progranulin-like n=1 Tax=Stegodyphus dumicola TaxID=202533 RepID=UPI0015AEC3B2|nr:progranulin-like [Stegodyphus dumicola]